MRLVTKRNFLILSWALYDLANQFFAMNVVSLYFVRWLTLERKMPEFFFSVSFGISNLFVGILAPIMGLVSDISQRRRLFLIYFTLLSVIFTFFLGEVKRVFLGLLFFAIANFGYQLAVVFYNAQLVNIAPQNKLGLVSGLGRMLGYSGAILALYIIKPIVLKSGYQATFLPTAILFLLFALPCMIFIKDLNSRSKIDFLYFFRKDKLRETFRNIGTAFLETYRLPHLTIFLKSAFFGLCGVHVILLFMSIYATRAFGLNEAQIINLIAFSTLFAMGGSLFSGFISDYIGYKRTLCMIFSLWGICFFWGAVVRTTYLYWLLGGLVGIALGSTWAVSRSLLIRLVPKEKVGEVFGLFNLVGYFSAIIGTLFWGIILMIFSPLGEWGYRLALFSLNLFVILALFFLFRLPRDA